MKDIITNQNSKRNIFLVHGWGGTSKSLKNLSVLLKEDNAFLLDLPGFGDTKTPPADWG